MAVGTSGKEGERRAEVTAMGLSLPLRMCADALPSASKM
jgi:hypothetical protein